jgi:hypothetical protein
VRREFEPAELLPDASWESSNDGIPTLVHRTVSPRGNLNHRQRDPTRSFFVILIALAIIGGIALDYYYL